jgi:hypothetical protein
MDNPVKPGCDGKGRSLVQSPDGGKSVLNAIGTSAFVVFMIAWLAGVVCWLVAAFHMIKYWIDHFKGRRGQHAIQSLKAMAAFVGCVLVGAAAGVVGDWYGNW